LPIGEIPSKIVLQKDLGGRLDGTPWSSEELLSGKIIILFHANSVKKDLFFMEFKLLKKKMLFNQKCLNIFIEKWGFFKKLIRKY